MSQPQLRLLALLTALLAAPTVTRPLAAQGTNTDPRPEAMGHDTAMPHDAMMMPHGGFAGDHGHTVSGSYEIATENGATVLKLGADFSLDGAPDPYVVLSPTTRGGDSGALNLGRLKSNRGAQSYALPAHAELSQFKTVIIYCKKYDVTLGSSALAARDDMMH